MMEVNLKGYYGTVGKDKNSHTSVEKFPGEWDNGHDHQNFRNMIYKKYPNMHIIGYAVREDTPTP